MKTIQSTILIHQPVERVFEFFMDPQKDPVWQPEVVESSTLEAEPGGAGVRTRTKARGFAGLTLEVIGETLECVPNQKLTSRMREVHGWINSLSQWRFESAADGTQVTVQHDVELHGWLRLLGFLVVAGAQRKIDGDMLRLKELLEKK